MNDQYISRIIIVQTLYPRDITILVRWTYDTKNNLTKTEEKLNGNSWTTEYTYDSDNRVTSSPHFHSGTRQRLLRYSEERMETGQEKARMSVL